MPILSCHYAFDATASSSYWILFHTYQYDINNHHHQHNEYHWPSDKPVNRYEGIRQTLPLYYFHRRLSFFLFSKCIFAHFQTFISFNILRHFHFLHFHSNVIIFRIYFLAIYFSFSFSLRQIIISLHFVKCSHIIFQTLITEMFSLLFITWISSFSLPSNRVISSLMKQHYLEQVKHILLLC